MACPAKLDFNIQRNEDFGPFAFGLRDTSGVDITTEGWNFSLIVDVAPGRTGTPALSISQFANANGSYVDVTDDGMFEIFIARGDMAALAGSVSSWDVFAYNLIGSDPAGYEVALARGMFIAEPGV